MLGVCQGAKEDAQSWRQFLRHLKGRGLQGVWLVTSDKCVGLLEALREFYPEAGSDARCIGIATPAPRGTTGKARQPHLRA